MMKSWRYRVWMNYSLFWDIDIEPFAESRALVRQGFLSTKKDFIPIRQTWLFSLSRDFHDGTLFFTHVMCHF